MNDSNSTQTAEPQANARVIAGLGRRVGAMAYDFILLIALWAITGYAAVAINGGQPVYGALWQSLLFLEAFVYFAWSWCTTGQTVGMLAWRLHLVTEQPRFTLDQASYRVMGALVSFVFLGLGYLWLLFHPQRKTWADLMSNSQLWYQPKIKS